MFIHGSTGMAEGLTDLSDFEIHSKDGSFVLAQQCSVILWTNILTFCVMTRIMNSKYTHVVSPIKK